MENSQEIKYETNNITNSQEIIQRIMCYSPQTFHGSQSHPLPLIDKFNVQYLTNLLDRSKIQSIDKVYRSKEDGFNLLEFVRFFLNVIEHEEIQTLYLTIALIDFFKEISQICGYRERLHFIDITNYICNRILEKRDQENQIESKYIPDYRTIVPNFKIKDYLLNPPRIYASKDELVYKLSLNKIKIDKMKHEGVVMNCYFSSSLMKVFTLDDLSDSISVYNTNCSLVRKIKPNFSKLKKDIVVLSFAYSQRQQRIGAVLKDFSINFWDNSDNFQFQKSISTAQHCQEYQTNIWFFEYFNAWVTSDKTGHLYIWNLQTQKPERKIKLVSETQINDLAVIPCINLIAVVQERKIYVDTKVPFQRKKKDGKENSESSQQSKKQSDPQNPVIYLYDFFKGEVATKIELGSQNRNPHTLQYSQNYQVLLSAGYEKKISIFQINKTFLDTCKKGQLTGHESLITSFIVLRKSPMVISADDKGKVKIWDIRNYKCIQTLDFRDKTNITKLLDMIELGKIGVLGSRINFVEFDEKAQIQKKIHIKQKLVPLWIECDYGNQELLVLTKKDLRVIDMRRGVIKSIYCQFHLQDIEITYFKYFETLKKFVIGNQKGQIKIYCIRTGRLEGRLMDHSGSIVHIEYDQQNKIFITMGQDSAIQIQKHLLGAYSQKQNQIEIQANTDQIKESIKKYKFNPLRGKKGDQPQASPFNRSVSDGNLNANKTDGVVDNKISTNSKQDPNLILLRQIKNNFNGRQLTFASVSIYHGFLAVGSSEKNIYIWDYQFSKLLIEINLPEELDPNVQPTSLAFINGYSILAIGTSEGTVYFVKITKLDQNYKIKTIGVFRSSKSQPIITITTDLLVKGFSANRQKFVHCKVYVGHSFGQITCINLTDKLSSLKQQPSIVHKKTFNAERQLRQNFMAQIQKKKYQSYTIDPYLDEPILGEIYGGPPPKSKKVLTFNKKQQSNSDLKVQVITFEAHKGSLTGLTVLQLDQCYFVTIGMDQRLKIWKENKLICDWNINLPLPFKWDMRIKNQQKKRDKIMFALKIIQQIFLKYGNDISINQSKCLKVRKLLDKVKEESQQDTNHMHQNGHDFITQPKNVHDEEQSNNVILFQNEFTKKDMHYDYVKKFNFNEIAGPTLREIEVQKKLDLIQKQWSINKEKVEEDKNKLLFVIRNRAQKNEEKEQILQFLEPKNYLSTKKQRDSTDNTNNSPYVKNLMNKIQGVLSPKMVKKQTLNSDSAATLLGFRTAKQNYMSYNNLQKSKMREFQQKMMKSLQREKRKTLTINEKQKMETLRNKNGQTFEKYFQQKQNSLHTSISTSYLPSSLNRTTSNFRDILTRMNERIKQSKKKKVSQEQISKQQEHQLRFLAIATSDGRRNPVRKQL